MQLPALGQIHDQYLSLQRLARDRFADSLAGALLLRAPLDTNGIAVVLAAGLAGAASLCLHSDPDQLREALRHGLCDFVVADLSESLRILKNELRRRRAVSVAVTANPDSCLSEMIDRGLQPDLLSLASAPQAVTFLDRGAILLSTHDPDPSTSLLVWSIASDPPRALPRLAQIASESLDESRPGTPARRRWLTAAPRHLGRAFSGRQCLRMTPAEAARFAPRAASEFPAALIERDPTL
jgi:hypothetical protein